MANFLKSLFVKGVEIDTDGADNGEVLTYNGTKFAPATATASVATLDAIGDVTISSAAPEDLLKWNGTAWVNSTIGASNQIIYKNSSGTFTGSSGLQYDGVSIKVNGNLESVYTNGDEGGEIFLNKATTNTTITNGVTIDVWQNRLRLFENGGTNRGYYLDITSGVTSAGTQIATTSNKLSAFASTSSSELAGVISDETGSGALVFGTSPSLTTPTLGVASATSINKVAITAPATSATLTIADGKTLTASNTLTFTGTDGSSVAFGAGGTVAYTGGTLAQFATTSSSQLALIINDETGSGALVFGTSPSITTSLTTTSNSFSLINTNATTVNFAGAATTLNIGGTACSTSFTGSISATGSLTTGNAIKSNGRYDADDSLSFWIARNNSGTVLFRASTASTVYSDTITGRAVQINSAGTMGTTTSTIRNKTEVSNYTFDTEAVLAIQPVRFKYKTELFSSEEDTDTNWQYGFIAEQALEAGVPELVGIDADGLPDYFAYERLCVAQQQVIRELWAKVEALEAKVG